MGIPVLGALWEKVVDKGGDIIKELVKDKDLAEQLNHEFRTQMALQEHEFKSMELQVEQQMFADQQKTIQTELHQSDLYTKRTRPKVARQSWSITALYGVSSVLLPVLPASWGLQAPAFSWEVFLVLASPALTYMGVRGFEKFGAKQV